MVDTRHSASLTLANVSPQADAALATALLDALENDSHFSWHGTLCALLPKLRALYGDERLGSGERCIEHALGMALGAATLGLDVPTRLAALLFALGDKQPVAEDTLFALLDLPRAPAGTALVATVQTLIGALARLKSLRSLTQAEGDTPSRRGQGEPQAEVLRKMLLAMASDIRVVLLRLLSRTQTLRHYSVHPDPERIAMARETLAIYAPLANRLGVWQLKWEMEDRAFRFVEPETYRKIARLLDEKRGEREAFMARVITTIEAQLAASDELAGKTQVFGRPKHIYSIWNKMRSKGLAFEQLFDVRAIRIIVPEVRDCYTVLGIVHHLWQPIRGEFDDYISHPKGNDYRSLHTAVLTEEGRSLEVQIRTADMHRHAELGVAAHWRYKEAGKSVDSSGEYEDKIAWLRQLLSWREEVSDTAAVAPTDPTRHAPDLASGYRRAGLDDTLYVITPQGRVIDLPRGATPIDFAYRVHTDLGHRCRGARVDGQIVPLASALKTGQQVDIITAKSGGPSRDWLGAGFITTARARQKVRQWFAAQETAEQLGAGRAFVLRELHRLGERETSLDLLAGRLGLKSIEALFIAAARGDIGVRAIGLALRGDTAATSDALATAPSRADDMGKGNILIVGVDNLLTQMGRCCKPLPPDAIAGFVTRGKGISVHRVDCHNFHNMAKRNPERIISAEWGRAATGAPGTGGSAAGSVFAVDLVVEAGERNDLLRSISDVLLRERVPVTAMKSRVHRGQTHMVLSVELAGAEALTRILAQLRTLPGIASVRRR